MSTTLRSVRRCFEGAVPAVIGTCATDLTPNIAYLSQVHYVDEQHVALSYQFFNKTRENILANPRATLQVIDPESALHYRLHLEYLRTETAGPLFELMKVKLAGIASHTGMSKVFRLLGADIYRVLRVEPVSGSLPVAPSQRIDLLPGLRAAIGAIAGCGDMSALLDHVLTALQQHFDVQHSMLLLYDAAQQRLFTVASHGYADSGVGSEVCLGEGIIGVAAREHTPIRIGYAAQEYLYSRATRTGFACSKDRDALETEIPFPGLEDSRSQLAVPLLYRDRLTGVLFVESPRELRFTYEDEDALVVLAGQLALELELMLRVDHHEVPEIPRAVSATVHGTPANIRHFARDHSVFIDNAYLIKGVAGAILWTLLREYVDSGRTDFSNRELRHDRRLGLPDITDNLEARLILLQRRLAERCSHLAIEKTGRGCFRLHVQRPVSLSEDPAE
ncbi:MAG: GAF domain-containing protein [Sedimenticolaceae bacterium]